MALVHTTQVLPHCSIGNVLIYQHLFSLFEAKADKVYEILVMNSGKQLNLCLEFMCSLHGSLLCPLDRNNLPACKDCSIDLTRKRELIYLFFCSFYGSLSGSS